NFEFGVSLLFKGDNLDTYTKCYNQWVKCSITDDKDKIRYGEICMKKDSIYQYIYIFYSFVFALSIMNVFIESDVINYIIGILAIIMVIVSFSRASRLFKILSGSFLLIGGYIYFSSGESLLALPSILTNNMLLLAL